jgi:hypothetical protein
VPCGDLGARNSRCLIARCVISNLFHDGARARWSGAICSGSGPWAVVLMRFNAPPLVYLHPTEADARYDNRIRGGKVEQITPAKRLPPPDLGWE